MEPCLGTSPGPGSSVTLPPQIGHNPSTALATWHPESLHRDPPPTLWTSASPHAGSADACSLVQTQEVAIPAPAQANRPASLLSHGLKPPSSMKPGPFQVCAPSGSPHSDLGCHAEFTLSHSWSSSISYSSCEAFLT